MEKTYKNALILCLILIPIIVILEIFFPVSADIYYMSYFDQVYDKLPQEFDILILIIFALVIVLHVISIIMLYMFKKISRKIFNWTTVFLIILTLSGPTVYTGPSAFIETVGSVLLGAIFVFIYFTPLSDKFR